MTFVEELARDAARAASLPASLSAHPEVKDFARRLASMVAEQCVAICHDDAYPDNEAARRCADGIRAAFMPKE